MLSIHADKRQELTYRFASAQDLILYYGQRPRVTTQAVMLFLDGDPAGIIGLSYDKHYAVLFSEYKPSLVPHISRIQIMRALVLVMRWVHASRRPIYAARSGDTDILEKLGFEQVEGEVYRWHR